MFSNSESIFYLLSWKHLAGFNYMVETLMSHEVYAEEGRCIPFTLDPTHKKKAIALHDQEYTQQVAKLYIEDRFFNSNYSQGRYYRSRNR